MFAAALACPQPPSAPCGVYHALLVQAVKLHGALSSPPRRGLATACLLRGAPGWLRRGGILLSPAGHPQHGLQHCPGFEDSRGHDLAVTAKEEGTHLRFSLQLCCLCGFRHPSAMFFPCPRRGGRSAKLTSGCSQFIQTGSGSCGPLGIQDRAKLRLTARRCLYPVNPQLQFIGVSNQLGPSITSRLL